MGLLTILKKLKQQEREMRLLVLCVAHPSLSPPRPLGPPPRSAPRFLALCALTRGRCPSPHPSTPLYPP
jgi:hypothetical protein